MLMQTLRGRRADLVCLLALPLIAALAFTPRLLSQEKGKEKGKETTEAKGEKPKPSATKNAEAKKPDAEVEAKAPEEGVRKTLAGRWVFVLNQRGDDIPLWLLEITPDGNSFKGEIVETNSILKGESKLKQFKTDGTQIDLKIDGPLPFNFSGRFADGMTMGEWVDSSQVIPIALKATEVPSIRKGRPTPASGMRELKQAMESESFEELEKFLETHPRSVLTFSAIAQLLRMLPEEKLDQAAVEKFTERAIKAAGGWGPNLATETQLQIGTVLAQADLFPELALADLTAVEKSTALDVFKTTARTERGKLYLKGERHDDGVKLLHEILTANPFEAELIYLLARDAEKQTKIDDAIGLYAELVALPQFEQFVAETLGEPLDRAKLPSSALNRLWKEKHGGKTDGKDAFVFATYERKTNLGREKVPPRKPDAGNRVALLELFTGARCPPCVSADLALANVDSIFEPSEVIVLRYHTSFPGPDPLANSVSEARLAAYEVEATPTVRLNGVTDLMVPGGVAQVKPAFEECLTAVQLALKESTKITLQLSADNKDGKVAINATAAGEEFSKSTRLRLALAETHVNYPAPNGLRVHEMVVRAMPGGVAGIKPVDGKLTYTGTVDLEELRADLAKEMKAVEKKLDDSFKFDVKPLDFKSFALVAFVQDEKTGEVLQAASIAVPGLTMKAAEAKPAKAQ